MIFYYRHISIFLPFRHLRFLQTNVHHTNVVLLLYNFESPDPPNCRLPKFLGDSSLFLSNHNPMKNTSHYFYSSSWQQQLLVPETEKWWWFTRYKKRNRYQDVLFCATTYSKEKTTILSPFCPLEHLEILLTPCIVLFHFLSLEKYIFRSNYNRNKASSSVLLL